MRVQLVSICPTDAAKAAGRPALTPELLAATGARYSRSNDGLDAILSRIDPQRLDASVDSIFKMLDFGHQSIADMVPVAIFIDGISMWLALHVWSLSPLAGGQESSTRYIRMSQDSLLPVQCAAIKPERHDEWLGDMTQAFGLYRELEDAWTNLAHATPEIVRIPTQLLQDKSEKSLKAINRMRRNFAFDRARYLLPSALKTNMMLIMSARAWATLCRGLLSDVLPEAKALGEAIRAELSLSAPHLMRHALASDDVIAGLADEMAQRVRIARSSIPAALEAGATSHAPDTVHLEVMPPPQRGDDDMAEALKYHSNRYAWQGYALRQTSVRFAFDAIAIAELRDLNRHRTGSKFSQRIPVGYYGAQDQLPQNPKTKEEMALVKAVERAAHFGRRISRKAHDALAQNDPSYVYWTLLGTQLHFEHVTTADKFIYEAELRTGTGSHYRYARHMRLALQEWYRLFPQTKDMVLEGSAEPE